MKSSTVVKSAFPKITPRIVAVPPPPAPPVPPKAAAPAQKPKAPKTPKATKPLPKSLEVRMEVVDREDRSVPAWVYVARNTAPDTAVVVIVANRHHELIRQCVERLDGKLFAWIAATPFAEWLVTRRKWDALAAATDEALREILIDEDKRHLSGIMFFSQGLASSGPFKGMLRELLHRSKYGELTFKIGSVRLERAEIKGQKPKICNDVAEIE